MDEKSKKLKYLENESVFLENFINRARAFGARTKVLTTLYKSCRKKRKKRLHMGVVA